MLCRLILPGPYPEKDAVFRLCRGIVRDVDSRRYVPRTDLLLADPRLAEAEHRLGRALVKAAVGRAQQRARDGQIAPGEVADAAVAELPARAAALTPVLNATGCWCTPTWGGRRSRPVTASGYPCGAGGMPSATSIAFSDRTESQ